MKRLALLLFVWLLSFAANAQKVTYSKGVVMFGDSIACYVEPMGSLLSKSYSFKDKNGEELVFFKRRVVKTPELADTTKPQETITYFEILMRGIDCFAEIGENELGFALLSEKKTILKLAQYLFSNRVIKHGEIDIEAATYFCQKTGAPYTDAIQRLEYKHGLPVEIVQ